MEQSDSNGAIMVTISQLQRNAAVIVKKMNEEGRRVVVMRLGRFIMEIQPFDSAVLSDKPSHVYTMWELTRDLSDIAKQMNEQDFLVEVMHEGSFVALIRPLTTLKLESNSLSQAVDNLPPEEKARMLGKEPYPSDFCGTADIMNAGRDT